MAVTGIGTYASYTNSYGNTQNAGNKTGRTYKNAHEYKNYLTQKYDCLRSRDYSVNINSSLLSEAMGDEKTKQWLEYNLSLIPKTIEQSRAYVAARGAKILSYSITINGYDSMSSVMCTQDEVDPGTEKARKELEERLEKRKEEKNHYNELILTSLNRLRNKPKTTVTYGKTVKSVSEYNHVPYEKVKLA